VTYNFAVDVAAVESPQKAAALAFDHRDFRNDFAGTRKAEGSFVEGAGSGTTLWLQRSIVMLKTSSIFV
jgi:hypothetical protein